MAETAQQQAATDLEVAAGTPKRKVNMVVLGIAAALALAAVLGVVFTLRFIDAERERDIQAWQIRLGIVADSRVAAVNEWVDQNFAVMRELAENASLQLYMTELALSDGDRAKITDEAAQAGYLRNLLVATAERTGFAPPPMAAEVSANIERAGIAGIALVDAGGRLLVSSSGMPPPSPALRRAIARAVAGEPALLDLHRGATNLPTIGFVLPIFALQGDETQGIGAVIGLRVVGDDLWRRLVQPGQITKSAETYLVRKEGGSVEYLSPLADGTPPLERTLALTTPSLAAAFALENPGGFAIMRDYAGRDALVASRTIAQAPWTLIRKVDRDEALAGTETRLRTILIVFILIIVGVSVALIAVWRHGTSVRAAEAAERFRIAAERFQNLSKFMNVVTNSQPTEIVAVDMDGHYTFANETAARKAGMEIPDMMGKTTVAIMGPIQAQVYLDINKRVIQEFKRETHVHTFEQAEGHARVLKSEHIPLRGDRDHPPGALMILDDITELTRERERREQVLRQLVQTLVGVVDRRDPFSANHSAYVAEISGCIADEMGLDENDQRTVEIAGALMNLGKILIPEDLLTKTGQLTAEERERVTKSYMDSAELLEGVEFDGPVVQTIREMGENWDGSGPLGLSGGDILRTARIIAVANDFVGMLSPRAWRDALTFEKVSAILLSDAGVKYDRRAVSALINFLENRGGRTRWERIRERPKDKTADG